MPKRDYPRIEITTEAHTALNAEWLLTKRPLREIASAAIMAYVSERALAIVDEIAKAPPAPSKIFKNKSALEEFAPMPAPRARHGGKPPLEETDPQLAQEILLYYGGGKRKGGHSRNETAKHFGVGDGQVDKLVRRSSEKKQK